jgi:adenine-specific DNA-methyltransferase
MSFEVPSVSLHVHERIDPRTIIEGVKRKNGGPQMSLFQAPEENPPLREAVEFYKHKHGWSNRLIAGDSLLVMNSLLEKEGMADQIQMVYFDPPYGIRYGSNFQPFVNKRDVKDGKDEDLTAEPEMIKAFRDTWELGIHSYISYLRDRLLLVCDLLSESGSVFVQISDENVHHVREVMDEIFGVHNFCALITIVKTSAQEADLLPSVCDYLLWYARDLEKVKFRKLRISKRFGEPGTSEYNRVELPDGTRRLMTDEEQEDWTMLPSDARPYRQDNIVSQRPPGDFPVNFEGKTYRPITGYWKTGVAGMSRLIAAKRIERRGAMLSYVRFYDDFPYKPLTNFWADVRFSSRSEQKQYVVQTATRVIERCLLMASDPGDLVLDITCGSGTTAAASEQWGRRWITCDTSRVALAIAKQRLMAAVFDYYQLAHPDEGVDSGFALKVARHVMLKTIANGDKPEQEVLYDRPLTDSNRTRVSGPFTFEAVPAPAVRSLDETDGRGETKLADKSIARSGATARDRDWRDELVRTGIRGKLGQRIEFTRVEPLPGMRWLHADAETKEDKPQRVVVSFGPEHAPLEQRQVELAIDDASKLVPKPKMIIFAAFQFDPEAAKDIDELNWPGVILLKAQMNADLLTEDLKKKRASNESFWLIGQPDIEVQTVQDGEDKGKCRIAVNGFDYYNTKNGHIESGSNDKIAMWMLDPDYDGRSLFPRQVFFPMAGVDEGWSKLAKNLRAEIDPDLIEAYRGTVSLPFAVTRKNQRAAVKIIDDRGIESLRILDLE